MKTTLATITLITAATYAAIIYPAQAMPITEPTPWGVYSESAERNDQYYLCELRVIAPNSVSWTLWQGVNYITGAQGSQSNTLPCGTYRITQPTTPQPVREVHLKSGSRTVKLGGAQ